MLHLVSTLPHCARRLPRRLLTAALVLGWVSVASAQLLWEDGFEGPALDPAWEITTQNVSSWSAGFEDGAWHVQTIEGQQSNAWSRIILGRSLPCRDELLITAELEWIGNSNPVMQQALLQLRDGNGELLVHGGYDDAWVAQRGQYYGCVGPACQSQGYGSQPHSGILDLQAILHDGQYSLLLDGVPYISGPVDASTARLELMLSHFEHPTSTFGGLAIHTLRLESTLDAPGLAIQADSNLVLHWPVQHCSPVRVYQAPSAEALWPGEYILLGEVPAGTDHWPLPSPAPDSRAVFRLSRVLE